MTAPNERTVLSAGREAYRELVKPKLNSAEREAPARCAAAIDHHRQLIGTHAPGSPYAVEDFCTDLVLWSRANGYDLETTITSLLHYYAWLEAEES